MESSFTSSYRLVLALAVFPTVLAFALFNADVAAAQEDSSGQKYLFSYFKGNGEDGLHLAWSSDGLRWESLNGDRPFVSPQVGGKLMRDPSIIRDAKGIFHMVWSTGWWDLGFGYSSSKDLVHWEEQQFIGVNESVEGAKNTWAPDLFFDEKSAQFVIVFSTTVPGRFPETDQGGDHNHRMYFITTQDFSKFSAPKILFNPGYNSIDGTIFAIGEGLTLIYKDERPGEKQLHAATTDLLGDPWTSSGIPILPRDWVEGPTVLKVGDVWRLYFDCYQDGHYGAAESKDGVLWRDITDSIQIPPGFRHGTAFAVDEETLRPLLQLR